MVTRLVVCCDGTWNTPDQRAGGVPRPTNVTKLALSITPVDPEGTRQVVYYHQGVGTSRWDHIRGGAFGSGLSANVRDAYHFLIDNYEDGDELWFFGFSRGAFTARSVAGLVRNCGVLRRHDLDRLDEAYALYRARAESPRGTASTLFRHAYSYEPRVKFIGVWDTVGALGIPVPTTRALQRVVAAFNHRWAFHDTDLSTHVEGAFHALAIDEQRKAFLPTLWTQQPNAGSQVLEQVWFAGVHSDVGGGYRGAESGLSDVALLWMMEKARGFGLDVTPPPVVTGQPRDVSPGESAEVEVNPNPMLRLHVSRKSFYRLFRAVSRPIGASPTGRELLSSSAFDRHEKDPEGYRPANLVTYLDRPGGPDIAEV
ncbi:MAG: DUF2235 domain-containing protein [Nocardioides sp.]